MGGRNIDFVLKLAPKYTPESHIAVAKNSTRLPVEGLRRHGAAHVRELFRPETITVFYSPLVRSGGNPSWHFPNAPAIRGGNGSSYGGVSASDFIWWEFGIFRLRGGSLPSPAPTFNLPFEVPGNLSE